MVVRDRDQFSLFMRCRVCVCLCAFSMSLMVFVIRVEWVLRNKLVGCEMFKLGQK
jgi:hypothetical protein